MSWRDRAIRLLDGLLTAEISVSEFCDRYEPLWNFELESNAELGAEAPIFEQIFDSVVWYSPFPEDRDSYPGFKNEEDIIAIVRKANARLERS